VVMSQYFKHKITLAFVLSTVMAVIAIVAFLQESIEDFAIRQWEDEHRFLVATITEQIKSDLENAKDTLLRASRLKAFSSLPHVDRIDRSINGIPPELDREKREILEGLQGDNGPFSVLFVLLPNGDHYISHPFRVQKMLKKYNLSDRPYFKTATSTKQITISSSFVGSDGIPAVAIDLPILDEKGGIIAHLGGVFHLQKLTRIVSEKNIRPFDLGMLVDSQGHLIAHTDETQLAAERRRAYENHPLIRHHHSPRSDKPLTGPEFVRYTDSGGEEWLVYHSHFRNDWGVFLQRRLANVIAGFSDQKRDIVVLVTLIFIGISGIGIVVTVRSVDRWQMATDELSAIRDELESRVVQRTSDLQESETRMRILVETLPDLIWLKDAEGVYLQCNHMFERFFGAKQEEIVGRTDYDFVDRELADFFRQKDREAILAGKPSVNEEWITFATDQRRVLLETTKTPMFDAGGKMIGVLGIGHDITRRKEAENDLKQAASVFEYANEGIIITDANGNIINVNSTFSKLTGYAKEEVFGQNPSLLKSGRQSDEFYREMWQRINKEGFWRGEIWNRRKNGDVYPELLTITEVRSSKGEVIQYVGIFTDITKIKEHQDELEQMAHYDPLTRLPNRILLSDRITQAIARAKRSKKFLAVIYLDLDEFKPVNDTMGHEAGDQLLVDVSARLKECVRADDTVSRLGGDEFVMLLGDLQSVDECTHAMRRFLDSLSRPYQINGFEIVLSASIGAAIFPIDEADPETLIRHADQAMYEAKRAGRNRYHMFDPEHDRRMQDELRALERIRVALEREEFVLYYQPIVDMRRGRVLSVEALIRWQHPERGLLPPAEFLPTTEEQNLAIPLGDWVIQEAIRQTDEWQGMGLDMGININVSARHLQKPDFSGFLAEVLSRHPNLPHESVELEILETVALEDTLQITELIKACHRLGVLFALDDFGTGYSSLSYLKRLPVDRLKIDQSFIRDMLGDKEDFAIVSGIISLARAFNREVIAEGVESDQHCAALLELECDWGQGYGIARPMPADEIPGWVRAFSQ
jgi:diguanylate cyclase (GGDEF)-like protein/PAS domain S-box-containing protein